MPTQFRKLISLILAAAFLLTSSNLALAEYHATDTLAPYSIAQLLSEHDKDIQILSNGAFPDDQRQEYLALRKVGFEEKWMAQYASVLAAKMAGKVADLKKNGLLNITLNDAEAEIISQVKTSAARYGMPGDRKDVLISAISTEFAALQNAAAANVKMPEKRSVNLVPVQPYEAVGWLTVEEATMRLNALPHVNSMAALEKYNEELDKEGVTHTELLKRFRPELAQMADILKRTRPIDELNALADNNQLVLDGEDANDPVIRDRQINGLRDARRKLKFAIEESLAATDAVIENVGKLTAQAGKHMLLRPEGAVDLSSIIIVMKKGLAESVTGEQRMQGIRGNTLTGQYRIMRQDLRKTFAGGEGVVEVETKEDLLSQANELIAKGKRVIVLDDGTLTNNLNYADIQGKAGEKYCIITSSIIPEQDTAIIPFVNLNAMAMMGVGVIYDDLTLFELSYETFTGKDISEDLIAKLVNKVLWFVRALPRCIKITNELPDQNRLKKLFDGAA